MARKPDPDRITWRLVREENNSDVLARGEADDTTTAKIAALEALAAYHYDELTLYTIYVYGEIVESAITNVEAKARCYDFLNAP